jgi:hypothetical protein
MGAVAKSYVTKGFLIYEDMRKYLVTILAMFDRVKSYQYDKICKAAEERLINHGGRNFKDTRP